jgi:spoIIIJ-associated protein
MPETDWTLDEMGSRIDGFLGPVIDAAGFDLGYEISEGRGAGAFIQPDITVAFTGRDTELLLAYKAELLLALEHLTLEALKIPHDDRYRLIFDANDYRLLRIEELRMSAEVAAEKVTRSGMPFHFSPMTSRERRVLHLALRDNHEVRTESEGTAPHRHTVIYPADSASSGRPAR